MNRTKISVILIVLMVGFLAGCQTPAPEEEVSADVSAEESAAEGSVLIPEQVQKVVDIVKAIDADPDRTEAILEEAGMTADEYEDQLYEIAHDPELSQAYHQALAAE